MHPILALASIVRSYGDFAEIAASVYPVFVECAGEWLDVDNNAVLHNGQAWGTDNHFDGHHGTGTNAAIGTGQDNFESCMLQCIARSSCVMFHHIVNVSFHLQPLLHARMLTLTSCRHAVCSLLGFRAVCLLQDLLAQKWQRPMQFCPRILLRTF